MQTRIIAALASLLALTDTAFALPPQITPFGFGPASASSWLAGALAGYDWQRGSVVFGVVGDLSGTNLRSETSGGFNSNITNFSYPSGEESAKIDWYGTVRARLGWATGPLLVYGTAGLAFGHVTLANNYGLGTIGRALSIGALDEQTSSVRAGWVAGGGGEYMLNQNLSLNLEYQYVDLGSVGLGAMSAPAPLQRLARPGASVHAQFQVVTLGVTWCFPPPQTAVASSPKHRGAPAAPSNPWEGLYVGGRAGGAWGNQLNVVPPTRFLPPT